MGKRPIINVILDRSGSMMSIKEETISLFNSLLKEHKEARFTLTQFDSEGIDIDYMARKGEDVEKLNGDTYQPRGTTPLYDAIGITLSRLDEWLKDKGGRKRKVIVAIITDGLENSSREYTQAQIKSMIEEREGSDWQFIYMGANQDAYEVGQGMGVNSTISYSASAQSMGAGTQVAAAVMDSYIATGTVQTGHTDVKDEGTSDEQPS